MYHNIGGKIKVLARIVCAIGTILLAGSVATYVTSLFIYGFGELIESTSKIRSMMEQDRTEEEEDQEP